MPPTTLLIAPLALVLAVLLLLRRRAAGSAAPTIRESEEVRLLRLQVETLTEALREAKAGTSAPAAPAAEPTVTLEKRVEADLFAEPEPEPEPVMVEIEPETRPEPEFPRRTPPEDAVAQRYDALSRSLAARGRLREAALAQWAADLRVLAPLLGDRAPELHAGLTTLTPTDVASAVTAARSVAIGLLGREVVLGGLLPDTSHLTESRGPGRRAAFAPGDLAPDVSPDVLPDEVLAAMESVLVESAERAGDTDHLSVALRCDLAAFVAPEHADAAEATAFVREALEPHERAAFDVRLAG